MRMFSGKGHGIQLSEKQKLVHGAAKKRMMRDIHTMQWQAYGRAKLRSMGLWDESANKSSLVVTRIIKSEKPPGYPNKLDNATTLP